MKLCELFEATASEKRARKEARRQAQLEVQRERERLERERKEREERNRAQIGAAPTARELELRRMMTPINQGYLDRRREAEQARREEIPAELQQFYDPGSDEEAQGVYLRFVSQPNGKTMDAYWAGKLGTGYEAAKKLGAAKTLSTEDSSYIKLFNGLLKANEYVHVIVDKKNLRDNPEKFKQILHYLDQFSTDYLTGELDNEEPTTAAPTPAAQAAKPASTPARAPQTMSQARIEAAFVNLFKQHPDLSAQLARVPKDQQQEVRDDIHDVIEEHSGDLKSILPEVKEILQHALGS